MVRLATSQITYLVLAFAFSVFHSERAVVALDVGGVHDAVVCAKFTFRTGVEKSHIFEGSATDKNSSLASHRATLGLNRVNLEAKGISTRIFELKLSLFPFLFLRIGQNDGEVGVDLARRGFRRT